MSEPGKTPKLFDVRLMISALLLVYGVILVVLGATASAADLHKADGIRINLWVGIGMLAVSVAFGLWAWRRPLGARRHDEP